MENGYGLQSDGIVGLGRSDKNMLTALYNQG